jgi:hypothetical protein
MELELIKVDLYRFLGSFNHFVGPMKLLREMAINKNCDGSNHHQNLDQINILKSLVNDFI